MSYVFLDQLDSTITFVSAGHEPLILLKADHKSYEQALLPGTIIHFMAGKIYSK